MSRLRADAAWLGLLLVASFAFRAPALYNAPGMVNSDVAVVGLQAIGMLHGKFAWFLPGSGYQTSIDSAVAAAWFALFGPSAFMLVLSALAGHVIATLLAFFTLRRHLAAGLATLLALLLVFTPTAVHTYALHPPRQAALTLVFLAFFLLDGASRRKNVGFYAAGGAIAMLACFADPYALVFAPALGVLGALALWDPDVAGRRRSSAVALVSGAVAGAIPFIALRLAAPESAGQLHFDGQRLRHNFELLRECLPWATSATIHYAPDWADYTIWNGGRVVGAVQKFGAAVLLLGSLSGLALFFRKSVPYEIRRLGFASALVVPTTLAGFLESVMVMDLFSARYLASIVLAAPFALLPLVHLAKELRSALLLAPYLASAALNGWLGFHPLAEGLRITRLGAGDDERALRAELEQRKLSVATGDYWTSYRLTFFWNEKIIVVPNHLREDRFAEYRPAFERARRFAYIFDRRRSRETLEKLPTELDPSDRFEVGHYVVFVVDKKNDTNGVAAGEWR